MFDELGPRAIKGIDAPIVVYRLREASGFAVASKPCDAGPYAASRRRRGTRAPAVALDRVRRRTRDRWCAVPASPGSASRASFRPFAYSCAVMIRPHSAARAPLPVLRAERAGSDFINRSGAAWLKKSEPPRSSCTSSRLAEPGNDEVAVSSLCSAPVPSTSTASHVCDPLLESYSSEDLGAASLFRAGGRGWDCGLS